jgi:hypothetical protein
MFPPVARLLALVLSSAAVLGGLQAQTAPAPKVEFPSASPGCTLKQQVGFTTIEINYSRPSMRGRTIFGGLEPYGEVWRTGANAATTIAFSTPVKVEGTELPAGSYELFTIPGEKEWTVIFHKNLKEWGAYSYKQADDVARVVVKPVTLAQPQETFTIEIDQIRDDSATLTLAWEKTCVPVKLQFEVVDKVVAQIDAVMKSDAPKKPYFQSALFYLDHNLDLAKAKEWMAQAIAAQPEQFWMYYHQARVLAKAGDKAGAIASAQHSIELARKAGGAAADEYARLNQTLLSTLQ